MPKHLETEDWLHCGSVEIHSLNAKEYNGQVGTVKGALDGGRYVVHLASGKEIRIKPENIRRHAVCVGVHIDSDSCHVGWLSESGFSPLVSMDTCIAFTASKRLFGAAAKKQQINNPSNFIPGYILLSMLGKNSESFARTQWSVAARKIGLKIEGEEKEFYSRTPTVQVSYRREVKNFGAEELLAMLLMELKTRAEGVLKGIKLADIVLSVPTSFGDGARKAAKDAVLVSGLKLARVTTHTSCHLLSKMMPRVLRGTKLVDKPQAVSGGAVNSDDDSEDEDKEATADEERHVLMVHAGELETDIVVASLDKGVVEVRAVGFMEGAHTFSSHLLRHCKIVLKQEQHTPSQYVELLSKCERSHALLGEDNKVHLEFDQGLDVSTVKLSFEEWLELTRGKQRLMNVIKEVTSEVPLLKISEVFVGGGHARLVMKLLRESCSYKCSLMPVDAVARGAALLATVLTGGPMADVLLIDTTSSSLGLETAGGVMSHLIAKNSYIPCLKRQAFSTYADNQDKILVQLYEGEETKSKDNQLLSTYSFDGFTPGARGVPQLEITFNVDTNGCCQVSGKEIKPGGNTALTVTETKENRLSRAQVNSMRKYHQEYLHGDQERENCLWELVRGGYIAQKHKTDLSSSLSLLPGPLSSAVKTDMNSSVFAPATVIPLAKEKPAFPSHTSALQAKPPLLKPIAEEESLRASAAKISNEEPSVSQAISSASDSTPHHFVVETPSSVDASSVPNVVKASIEIDKSVPQETNEVTSVSSSSASDGTHSTDGSVSEVVSSRTTSANSPGGFLMDPNTLPEALSAEVGASTVAVLSCDEVAPQSSRSDSRASPPLSSVISPALEASPVDNFSSLPARVASEFTQGSTQKPEAVIAEGRAIRGSSLPPPPPPRKSSCSASSAAQQEGNIANHPERRMSRIAPPPPQKTSLETIPEGKTSAVDQVCSSTSSAETQRVRRPSAPPPPRKPSIVQKSAVTENDERAHPLVMFFGHPLCDARKLLMDIGDYL